MAARKKTSTKSRGSRKASPKKAPRANRNKTAAKPRTRRKPPALKDVILKAASGVKPTTHVVFLLDASGSMRGFRHEVVRVFHTLAEPVRQRSNDQNILVSLFTFGDVANDPQFFDAPVSRLIDLSDTDYNPESSQTAMLDSIGKALSRLKALPDANDPNTSFLVIVITDGQENAHRPMYSAFQIRNWIGEAQGTDRWTFVFSCPNQYVNDIQKLLGVPAGNIKGWDQSMVGVQAMAAAQSAGLTSYFTGRASGSRATKDFFAEINIGKQGVRTVTKDLDTIDPDQFRWLTVDREVGVKEFIEGKKLKFELGRVFYPLTKAEEIHHHKVIYLKRRDNGKMYGGSQVRDKLGIPHGQNGKISPGNHGDWIILIQSTSPNRKLVRGTEIAYDLNAVVSNTGHGQVVST